MVRIEGSDETTMDGQEGTIWEIRVVGFTGKGAATHARGAIAGRFPVNIGKLKVLDVREATSQYPGLPERVVEVFMPHNNPSNPDRVY